MSSSKSGKKPSTIVLSYASMIINDLARGVLVKKKT